MSFPDDKHARKINSEFTLGENILVAPIVVEGDVSRDVYLPGPAEWKHLWTGDVYSVGEHGLKLSDFSAPIGQPAVFTRDTEAVKMSAILADIYPTVQEFLQ